MSFLMPKAPKMPPPPPPPAPPPPTPTRDDEAVKKAEQAERDRINRQAGRKASILTTGRGLLNEEEATTTKPSLIGGAR